MTHYRTLSNWVALVLIVGLVILAIWWSTANLISGYVPLSVGFSDPTNRMCRCSPIPFNSFNCETLGLKKVCCGSFDLKGRDCYCCTEDSHECQQIACEVPW